MTMSKPDKATSERFARTLRDLVKRPENKVCADCKRNDPRWASWNIGVFLCIRCSGIHRSMGTHISKVKSVDLDVWTPEQMESIRKWGNRRANIYWEAHLKPGHIPPEHKIESFIRSKYESRRWAMDGPPPTDPTVLDTGLTTQAPAQQVQEQPLTSSNRPTHNSGSSLSLRPATSTKQQPQAHQLLSANFATSTASSQTTLPVQPVEPVPSQDDLFSLDFHAPPPVATSAVEQPAKKDVKQDILSLFSTAPSNPAPTQLNQFGSNLWNSSQPQSQAVQPTSMIGNAGPGAWGASSGWTPVTSAAAAPVQPNVWGTPGPAAFSAPQTGLFDTSGVWGGASSPSTSAAKQNLFSTPLSTTNTDQKKDDVFGDIWGSFK